MELSELLSAALVAFTIEVDNEFEARMPHHTTQERRRSAKRPGKGRAARGERGPWLVSLAMYENCMRWLPEEGLTVGELEALARTPTNLDGMRRWGYVAAESPRGGRVAKPGTRTVLRPTADGCQAQEVWRPLPGEVEGRWRERFGEGAVASLRAELAAAVATVEGKDAEVAGEASAAGDAEAGTAAQGGGYGTGDAGAGQAADGAASAAGDAEATDGRGMTATAANGGAAAVGDGAFPGPLPDTMPIVGYGLATASRKPLRGGARPEPEPAADLPLHALLARLLTAFARAYEAESRVSLAIGANLLTVLGPENAEPTRLRDLPARAGVAREPVAAALKFLGGRGLVTVAPDPEAERGKVASLTAAGERARDAGAELRARIEAEWGLDGLAAALAPIAGEGTAASPLFAGLTAPERGWRSSAPAPERLPRFPLVTHRGGFPDGS
jgi:DNA-binding MarR family transcriptional regulator